MASTVTLTLCILLVTSCTGVMGQSYFSIPDGDECDGKNPGDAIKDPLNCHNYYVCEDEDTVIPDVQHCHPGECFIPTNSTETSTLFSRLLLLIGVLSPNPCTSISSDPLGCFHECQDDIPQCTFECPHDENGVQQQGTASKRNDCSKYTQCFVNGVQVDRSCVAPDLYFNGQDCVAESSACCTCEEATCTGAGVISDPQNCHQYYICLEGGIMMDTPQVCLTGGIPGVCHDPSEPCEAPCPIAE